MRPDLIDVRITWRNIAIILLATAMLPLGNYVKRFFRDMGRDVPTERDYAAYRAEAWEKRANFACMFPRDPRAAWARPAPSREYCDDLLDKQSIAADIQEKADMAPAIP